MEEASRTLATLSRLALAVLLPVLMTGSVAAADLLITNGTSTKLN